MTQLEATKKVRMLREVHTDVYTANALGISKVTMYKRLRTGKWKKTELALIDTL